MTQFWTGDVRYRRGFLSVVLLSVVMLAAPISADAADRKVADDIVGIAVPDAGLPVPSTSGSVVIRGTRPTPVELASPNVGETNVPRPTGEFPIGPYSGGWFNPALTSPGWDSKYDYGGLNPATTPH